MEPLLTRQEVTGLGEQRLNRRTDTETYVQQKSYLTLAALGVAEPLSLEMNSVSQHIACAGWGSHLEKVISRLGSHETISRAGPQKDLGSG